MANEIEMDIQVWEDPDADALIYENIGGIDFAGDNMLLIKGADDTVLAGFNSRGWYRYECSLREVVEEPEAEPASEPD